MFARAAWHSGTGARRVEGSFARRALWIVLLDHASPPRARLATERTACGGVSVAIATCTEMFAGWPGRVYALVDAKERFGRGVCAMVEPSQAQGSAGAARLHTCQRPDSVTSYMMGVPSLSHNSATSSAKRSGMFLALACASVAKLEASACRSPNSQASGKIPHRANAQRVRTCSLSPLAQSARDSCVVRCGLCDLRARRAEGHH